MATVINEYTDWERPVRHPISTREETLSLLSDALYGAPVMHTGNLHSLASSKTYLYVFDYQTRNGDFEQVRMRMVPHLIFIIALKGKDRKRTDFRFARQ